MWNAKHLIHLGSNGRGTSLLSKDSNLAQILVAKEDGIYTYYQGICLNAALANTLAPR